MSNHDKPGAESLAAGYIDLTDVFGPGSFMAHLSNCPQCRTIVYTADKDSQPEDVVLDQIAYRPSGSPHRCSKEKA